MWSRPLRRVLVAAGAFCLLTVAACIETAARGPYTAWYNQKMKAESERARLLGKPCSEVERVLGGADEQRAHGSLDPAGVTLEFYPYPWLPYSKFQVHCPKGTVSGVEMFDD